jgi:hypothetical protein
MSVLAFQRHAKGLMSARQRLQSSWHAEITTVRVTGTCIMRSSHAAGCWILEKVSFPAACCYTCPAPKIAQNDASLPCVPNLRYIFPEMGILLRRPRSLTTDQRFVILNQLVWDHDIPLLSRAEMYSKRRRELSESGLPSLFVMQTKGRLCQLRTRPKVA